MKDTTIVHEQLGTIVVKTNARASRFTFRAIEDGFSVTVPRAATKKDLEESIEKLLPRLLKLRQKHDEKVKVNAFSLSTRIDAPCFKMDIREGEVRRPSARLQKGRLTITCPPGTQMEDKALQDWMLKVVEESLRRLGKVYLIQRISELARKYGFSYQQAKIHKTHGRWGSCSGKKNINLSLYLMLLPTHLQDYVLLHELCHTLEMNHGARFWAKLDEVTGGCALSLRDEMKRYDTSVFCFCQ